MKHFLLLLLFLVMSCNTKQSADTIFYNAKVYTVDEAFSVVEAIAIKDGKVVKTGSTKDILEQFNATEQIDASGKYIYPGFNDAHAHLYGLGENLRGVELKGTSSFEEIVQKLVDFQKEKNSSFIVGRGWDQNDWYEKAFPTKDTLDILFPDTPVVLTRVDGHAMLVNQKALDLVGITTETEIDGGEIVKIDGKLTGVLVDNPMILIENSIPPLTKDDIKEALLKAQDIAVSHGLTSLTDAGLARQVIETIREMYDDNTLKLKMNIMVSNSMEDIDYYLEKGVIKTPRLRVGSVKVYADGALGSRGAALKKPYSDQHNHFGAMVIGLEDFDALAYKLSNTDYQMNTHAIGDSANSVVLKTYKKHLKDKPNKRWRVEHAQVLDSTEYHYFSKNIIPSVQPTHATSDMYWAEDRLGEERIKHAYAYKKLLDVAGVLPLGTDFPVEDVNPLLTFYAAVSRKDTKGYPENGFQMQNALSRKEALIGMTKWAAYAAFEEEEKGTIEEGKYADFTILEEDLMSVEIEKIPGLKVYATYINGEAVYQRN
jgi:predicted amidohydrolase YtcJ